LIFNVKLQVFFHFKAPFLIFIFATDRINPDIMHLTLYRAVLFTFGLVAFLSCQPPSEQTSSEEPKELQNQILAHYRGILPSPEYDSIVNQLTLYRNETFDLHQVDRIAEHHLHEKDHKGIYTYLADSTQLALYTDDGILMLRFLLTDRGLIPMRVGGDQIPDSSNIWKIQQPL